jgi:hypothetical protein
MADAQKKHNNMDVAKGVERFRSESSDKTRSKN